MMPSRKSPLLLPFLLLFLPTYYWQPCEAFLPVSSRSSSHGPFFTTRMQQSSLCQDPSPSSSSMTKSNNDDDDMRHDIDAMKREAERRLAALSQDLQEFQNNHHNQQQQAAEAAATTPRRNRYMDVGGAALSSLDSMEGDVTRIVPATLMQQAERAVEQRRQHHNTNDDDDDTRKITNTSEQPSPAVVGITSVPLSKATDDRPLEGTRWKIVFNVGREPGTWMPPAWGASGERLRFTVVVDLSDEILFDREDFFEGMAGARKLRVLEAWLGPTFDSSHHGRRRLRVKPTGGYKVVHGAGPLRTDVFRFYLEVEEAFRAKAASDVYCPRGRVYGNCGYFPTLTPQVRDSYHAYKEKLKEEYRATANQYDRLQQEKGEDLRLISWDKFSRMQEEVKLRKRLQELDLKIQEARQREPEKAQLRLSRKGDVGLTKDGGVCCKVQKGLALEYHILGRMEIASLEKEHGEVHEEYDDLVSKLHP